MNQGVLYTESVLHMSVIQARIRVCLLIERVQNYVCQLTYCFVCVYICMHVCVCEGACCQEAAAEDVSPDCTRNGISC